MEPELLQPLTQFGVAGLMGVLWVWERLLSRKREDQLDDAHGRLVRHTDEWRALLETVQRNTQALERFEQTQAQLKALLERMSHDLGKPN